MAWPTPKVSIAFDDGPYVANPTWTDITSYVYSADVSRGRADDYSQFIGTAQVVLNNNSRLFDPFYTAGTYYGKLLPRRQIKIEGVSNSVTYAVFRGFVDGFPASWDQAGKFATTTLSCFDGLSFLSAELLPDYVYDYTKTLNPIHYWRCNDGQQSVTITDNVAGRSQDVPTGLNYISYQQGSQITSALPTSAIIVQGNSSYSTTVTTTTPTVGDCTISGWFQAFTYSGIYGFWGLRFNSDYGTFQISYQSASGKIRAQVYNPNVSIPNVSYKESTNTYSAPMSTPVFITATYTKSTMAVALYINGIAQTGASSSLVSYDLTPITSYGMFLMQTQEQAIFPYVLTAAQALALYNANNNIIVETSAARMTRLLGYTSWDATLQSITASPVASVGSLSPPNSNLVAEMQLVNNSEDGDLFVTRAGVIKFTDRNYVYTNTSSNTSQATFASGSIPFQPSVQINYDAAAIRNDITVTFTGGGQTSTTNATSVTAYGTNAMNTGTQLSTQAQAETLAAYQATVNGQLLTNISPVSVGVTAVTANWTTLLQLELLDRYTLTVQPPTGNSISQAELINRIEHRIVPGQWQMTVDGSARYSSWFILDKSSLNGTDLLQ